MTTLNSAQRQQDYLSSRRADINKQWQHVYAATAYYNGLLGLTGVKK